jgi:hypothetical protein
MSWLWDILGQWLQTEIVSIFLLFEVLNMAVQKTRQLYKLTVNNVHVPLPQTPNLEI